MKRGRLAPENVDAAIRNLRLGTKENLLVDLWVLIDAYSSLKAQMDDSPSRIDLTAECVEIRKLITETKRIVEQSTKRTTRVVVSKDTGWDDFPY